MSLIVQLMLPCLLYNSSTSSSTAVTIDGGSMVAHSPTHLSLVNVFCPLAARMGVKFQAEYTRHGFFPDIIGQMKLFVNPNTEILPIDLTKRGNVTQVRVFVTHTHHVRLLLKRIPAVPRVLYERIRAEAEGSHRKGVRRLRGGVQEHRDRV